MDQCNHLNVKIGCGQCGNSWLLRVYKGAMQENNGTYFSMIISNSNIGFIKSDLQSGLRLRLLQKIKIYIRGDNFTTGHWGFVVNFAHTYGN